MHDYMIIVDENHVKEVPLVVSLSFFERIFIPKNWGRINKIVFFKTPNPDFKLDHVKKTITCHPNYLTKLTFHLQRIGDRDDFSWFYRPN